METVTNVAVYLVYEFGKLTLIYLGIRMIAHVAIWSQDKQWSMKVRKRVRKGLAKEITDKPYRPMIVRKDARDRYYCEKCLDWLSKKDYNFYRFGVSEVHISSGTDIKCTLCGKPIGKE